MKFVLKLQQIATSAYGINSTHTVQTITITGNVTGGSNGSAFGLYANGATGGFTISGNVNVGTASGASGVSLANGVSVTIQGNVYGHDTYNTSGATVTGGSQLTVTGNIIHGKVGQAVGGRTFFVPASATNYTLYSKDSSYVLGTVDSHATEMPSDPGIANVKSGVTYGTYTGTYSAGGGAWAF